jgi:hypothetical protein
MTLDQLIERLEELRDYCKIAGDTKIRGAFQSDYPLVAGISAVTTIVSEDEKEAGIYIALGAARDYGFGAMWDDEIVERGSED